MVPFGKHLRAYKNTGLTAISSGKKFLHRAFSAGAITVNSNHFIIGETFRQELFTLFRALTGGHDFCAITAWAMVGFSLLIIAMMTNKSSTSTMKG